MAQHYTLIISFCVLYVHLISMKTSLHTYDLTNDIGNCNPDTNLYRLLVTRNPLKRVVMLLVKCLMIS